MRSLGLTPEEHRERWTLKERERRKLMSREQKDKDNERKRAKRAADKSLRNKNAETNKVRRAVRMLDPEYRKAQSAKSMDWIYRNYEKHLARVSSRTSAKRTRVPSWANQDLIKKIYIEASRVTKETGKPHHVDHIVPLISPLVCGLHVEHNLQILDAVANIRKSNKSWPDMP